MSFSSRNLRIYTDTITTPHHLSCLPRPSPTKVKTEMRSVRHTEVPSTSQEFLSQRNSRSRDRLESYPNNITDIYYCNKNRLKINRE